jgi:hypothetical protein
MERLRVSVTAHENAAPRPLSKDEAFSQSDRKTSCTTSWASAASFRMWLAVA